MESKWLIYVVLISGGMTIAGIIIGWVLSFYQQRWTREQDKKDEVRRQEQRRKEEEWKQTQLRINTFLEKRWKTYSEGLEFVYEAEQHQHDAEELEAVQKKWSKWHPSNCLYLPPSVRDAFFAAMNMTAPIIVDLRNQDRDREIWRTFKEDLQNAKTRLMNLNDVGWLPEELK